VQHRDFVGTVCVYWHLYARRRTHTFFCDFQTLRIILRVEWCLQSVKTSVPSCLCSSAIDASLTISTNFSQAEIKVQLRLGSFFDQKNYQQCLRYGETHHVLSCKRHYTFKYRCFVHPGLEFSPLLRLRNNWISLSAQSLALNWKRKILSN
jgi:hypothetical protein